MVTKVAKTIGDRALEGGAYGNLGNAHYSLGEYRKAIKYHEKELKIAKEIGDLAGEKGAYGYLGNAYQLLSEYQKAIEYQKKRFEICKRNQ